MIDRSPPIMQLAFVVEDIDEAIRYWTEIARVGPFFVLPHVAYSTTTYMGLPSPVDITLAFAFTGDLQIELIQQHNNIPSVFQTFRGRYGYGVQHLGSVSDNFDDDVKRMTAAGLRPVQHLLAQTGAETIYFESEAHPAQTVELIRGTPRLHARFAEMKRAAAMWDGSTARAE